MTTSMYPNRAAEVKVIMPSRYQVGRSLAKHGYALSENIYVPGLYQVHKPDGSHYVVDTTEAEPTCNCAARVRDCRHVIFVLHCLRFLQAHSSVRSYDLQSSLYAPSRVPTLPAAKRERFSNSERAELAVAATRGTDINQDF